MKKLCHSAINLASNSTYKADRHTWLTFRLGEFYLDYAEAMFRYTGSAYATTSDLPMSAAEAMDYTRSRVGMPSVPKNLSQADFWEKYKNERMVELAFEGHRFWDVRRWKEAPEYFTSIDEMKLTLNADSTVTGSRTTVSRQWNDRMYLFPIPQTEIMKNPNLRQNPGW